MRGASTKVGECKTPISLLLAHASTKLQLVVMLVMFNVFSISAIAQSTAGTRESEVQGVAHTTMSPSSPWDSPPEDLKLSYPVRQLARSAGVPPNTMFHFCWDFNFFLMLGLIYWKCGPLLTNALQARSRSIQRAIEEAQRLADDAAKRLAEVEERWAKVDSEISAMQARAEVDMNYEEQALSARTAEEIRRMMAYSQSEIDRAAQRARHELKAFAADLAISLARESIQINKRTDEQLVQDFIQGLGHQEFALTTAHRPTESNRELVAASIPV